MGLPDGTCITGVDFGRVRNQIVACRIRVDSAHVDKGEIVDWVAFDYGYKATLVTVIEKLRKQVGKSSVFESAFFVLERQSPKNAFCYALSHVLYLALADRGHKQVRFVAPTQKFAILDPVTNGSTKQAVTYRSEKRRAIRLCNILILNQTSIVTDEYYRQKKKDDYADAFLYARAFLETRGTCEMEKPCPV